MQCSFLFAVQKQRVAIGISLAVWRNEFDGGALVHWLNTKSLFFVVQVNFTLAMLFVACSSTNEHTNPHLKQLSFWIDIVYVAVSFWLLSFKPLWIYKFVFFFFYCLLMLLLLLFFLLLSFNSDPIQLCSSVAYGLYCGLIANQLCDNLQLVCARTLYSAHQSKSRHARKQVWNSSSSFLRKAITAKTTTTQLTS